MSYDLCLVFRRISWVFMLFAAWAAEGAQLYVATNGSDTNPGTSIQPFKTIQRAANLVNPGDTVIVRDGEYTCDANAQGYPKDIVTLVVLKRSGTASAWITFKAEHPGKAILDGRGSRCFRTFQFGTSGEQGSFVRVEGFEVREFYSAFNVYWRSDGRAHDIVVRNNHIHHLARVCTDSEYGAGVAMGGGNFYNVTFERNIVHDNGRLRPTEGCASAGHYENHDHGIYVSGYENFHIRNNIFYRHLQGWAIHLYPKGGKRAFIVNNTFAFKNPDRDGHIIVAQTETDSVIANNIFYQPGAHAIALGSKRSYLNLQIKNNLTDAGKMHPLTDPSGVHLSGNVNSTNPKLISVSSLNFRLSPGSPCIGRGLNFFSQGVVDDLLSAPRPKTGAFDLGAYQFSGVPTDTVSPDSPSMFQVN